MKTALIPAALVLALITPALAQSPAPAPEAAQPPSYTLDQVPMDRPFDPLPVDPTIRTPERVQEMLAALNQEERDDILARCAVIAENEAVFQQNVVEFCAIATGD